MRSTWIASPSTDLIVGCGAWSLPLLLLPYLFDRVGQTWTLGFYTLALFVNYPHYMATIYRAYRTREDFVRYRRVTLYWTIFFVALLITAHSLYALVPWLVTIYLTWSPWHYMGQNFGLMLMSVHRKELKISRGDRNALWAAFVASYLLIFLRVHTAASTDPFFVSLRLPPVIMQWLRIPLTLIFFAGMVPLARLIREAGAKAMLAPTTLYITQFFWAVMPTVLYFLNPLGVPQLAFNMAVLAVMHCAQYLWITNYYARREAKAESGEWRWQGYLAVLVIGGIALFIPGPWLMSYAFGRDFTISVLIFTAVVNIHHFVLDGAIWKLRDSRVRSVLTASDMTSIDTPPENSWISAVRPWRLVGAAAIAGLLIIGGLDQIRYYLGNREGNISSLAAAAAMNPHDSVMQTRLGRMYETAGDHARMEDAFRMAVRANPDNLDGQNALARVLLESGRFDEAYAHYKEMFARVEPNAEALMNFGALCKMMNRREEAVNSLQRFLQKVPDYKPVQALLAELQQKF